MLHRGIPRTDGDGHWPFITSEPRCLLMPFLAQSSVLHGPGPQLYPLTLHPPWPRSHTAVLALHLPPAGWSWYHALGYKEDAHQATDKQRAALHALPLSRSRFVAGFMEPSDLAQFPQESDSSSTGYQGSKQAMEASYLLGNLWESCT